MTAEIVIRIEYENARLWPDGATIEPGGGKTADPCADHDEIVALLGRQMVHCEAPAVANMRMGGLEGTRMLSTQPGERRRITPACRRRLRRDLRFRRQPGRDGEHRTIEKI